MNAEQQAVKRWQELFGGHTQEYPDISNESEAPLRLALIAEEFNELIQAVAVQDPVKVADALGDLLFVTYGAGAAFGIDLEPVFWEITRSNLSKMPDDGIIQYREGDRKILKPATYFPPDLKTIIERQINDGTRTHTS